MSDLVPTRHKAAPHDRASWCILGPKGSGKTSIAILLAIVQDIFGAVRVIILTNVPNQPCWDPIRQFPRPDVHLNPSLRSMRDYAHNQGIELHLLPHQATLALEHGLRMKEEMERDGLEESEDYAILCRQCRKYQAQSINAECNEEALLDGPCTSVHDFYLSQSQPSVVLADDYTILNMDLSQQARPLGADFVLCMLDWANNKAYPMELRQQLSCCILLRGGLPMTPHGKRQLWEHFLGSDAKRFPFDWFIAVVQTLLDPQARKQDMHGKYLFLSNDPPSLMLNMNHGFDCSTPCTEMVDALAEFWRWPRSRGHQMCTQLFMSSPWG